MRSSWFGKVLILFILIVGIDLLVLQDKDFIYRWWLFSAWLVVLSATLIFLIRSWIIGTWKDLAKGKIDWLFMFALGLSILTRFIFLDNYPFPSIGDELRDGGLDAMRIATGELKNIFGYGRYDSHGLIIPTFNSIFYHFFGNSDLTYKVPSAIIGILDIMVVYYIAKRFIHRKLGLIAALVMIALPLHLYYSRTETVVIFSSLISSLLLLSLMLFLEKDTKARLLGVVLIIGFALNFHGSAKAAAVIAGVTLSLIIIYRYLNRGGLTKHIPELIGTIFLLIMGLMIGFGPRLMFSSPQTIFQTRSLVLADDVIEDEGIINPTWQDELGLTIKKYEQSLLVYFATPAHSHYADKTPILSPVVAPLFVLGLVMIFVSMNKYKGVILLFTLLLPLTNSAITDCLNCDHRLAPLYPFAALITTFGFLVLSDHIFSKAFKKDEALPIFLIIILAGILNLYPLTQFYVTQIANDNMFRVGRKGLYQSFMTQYIVEHVKKLDYEGEICLMANESNVRYMKYAHIREVFDYYLPKVAIEYSIKDDITERSIYIARECNSNQDVLKQFIMIEYCKDWEPFICPYESNRQFLIYYDPQLQ